MKPRPDDLAEPNITEDLRGSPCLQAWGGIGGTLGFPLRSVHEADAHVAA